MSTTGNIIRFPGTAATERPPAAGTRDPATIVDFSTSRLVREALNPAVRSAGPMSAPEIAAALRERRIEIHYQPQYEVATGKTASAEALVRLIDNDGQLVYPDRFIALVERTDLIIPLGRLVIERVCADLAASRAIGMTLKRVAVNVSARQFDIDTGLVGFVDRMIDAYGLDYHDLEFELTERQSLTPECRGHHVIATLSERGVRIVIDDFGIGYASVVYLSELPVSAFKLDRALVSRVADDRTMSSVVESLLALADNLGIEVVAEGVETEAQHQHLACAGCPYAQGFGYARPMSLANLHLFMRDNA